MGLRIVMLGAPASGKGTQAARLASHFDLPNLSTGALIRAEQRRGSALGKLADRHLEGGGFLPDDVVVETVSSWLAADGKSGFVLDGFPRTRPQAESLDAVLAVSARRLDAVVLLEADLETLQRRVASRVHCQSCGSSFRLGANGIGLGGACPQEGCGGTLATRSDDQPEEYAGRLANYDRLTRPLADYYSSAGVLHRVDGRAPAGEVFDEILARLDGRAAPTPAS